MTFFVKIKSYIEFALPRPFILYSIITFVLFIMRIKCIVRRVKCDCVRQSTILNYAASTQPINNYLTRYTQPLKSITTLKKYYK